MAEQLFEKFEDCQLMVSIMMRPDGLEALATTEKDQGQRLLAVLKRMCDVIEPPAFKQPPIVLQSGEDRLLEIGEAAKVVGYSTRWLYRNADTLPFTKVTRTGRLRFSAKGIQAWLQEQNHQRRTRKKA